MGKVENVLDISIIIWNPIDLSTLKVVELKWNT